MPYSITLTHTERDELDQLQIELANSEFDNIVASMDGNDLTKEQLWAMEYIDEDYNLPAITVFVDKVAGDRPPRPPRS